MRTIGRRAQRVGALVGCVAASLLTTSCPFQETNHQGSGSGSPIQFSHSPLPFRVENFETPRRHVIETMAGGVAAFDFDNDGDLDIYFTNGAEIPSLEKTGPRYYNRLFRNDGKGGFTDATAGSGLEGTGYDAGVTIGDYDGDDNLDVFVSGVHRNTLYRNNGDGTFSDVTAAAGINGADEEYGPLWSVSAVWLDYDVDGRLDLFVLNYMQWDPETERACSDYCHPRFYGPTPNRLYRNNGDGTFTDVSEETGLRAHAGKGMGVGAADFNGDHLPDLFATNDNEFNFLFRQTAEHRFEEVAFGAGVVLPEHGNYVSGMGVDARDYDNDGRPDIVFVALNGETFPVFHNIGDGEFEEVTVSAGLTVASKDMAGYSPGFFDFDNDGWKDLFVSRGHVQSMDLDGRTMVAQHNTVFRNLGDGSFQAYTEGAGFAEAPPRRHRGAAWGDFNGDGKLDVVVSALGDEAELWINDSPAAHHWIELDLRGTLSSRYPAGATVRIETESGAQYNHVCTTVGYGSSSAGPIHFGLGTAGQVEVIEIRWPSGVVQRLEDVAAGQVLRIEEPRNR